MRNVPKFDKWPRAVREICYSQGIRQDKETGLPVYDVNGIVAWSAKARNSEDKLVVANNKIKDLEKTIEALIDDDELKII